MLRNWLQQVRFGRVPRIQRNPNAQHKKHCRKREKQRLCAQRSHRRTLSIREQLDGAKQLRGSSAHHDPVHNIHIHFAPLLSPPNIFVYRRLASNDRAQYFDGFSGCSFAHGHFGFDRNGSHYVRVLQRCNYRFLYNFGRLDS